MAAGTRQLFASPRVLVLEDPDSELIERCRHGERDAFAELVVRHQKTVFNAALWILRKAEDASDVTQSVFLKVWERLDEFDGQHRFFSWLYRIAVNEALNQQRRTEREDELDEDFDLPDVPRADPQVLLIEREDVRQVQQALKRMATNDRMVLMLRHFSECSYDEIAHILGIDEKTVKSRLFEARRRLQGQLVGLRVN